VQGASLIFRDFRGDPTCSASRQRNALFSLPRSAEVFAGCEKHCAAALLAAFERFELLFGGTRRFVWWWWRPWLLCLLGG